MSWAGCAGDGAAVKSTAEAAEARWNRYRAGMQGVKPVNRVVEDDLVWAAKGAALRARDPEEEARTDYFAGDRGIYEGNGRCPGLEYGSGSLFDPAQVKLFEDSRSDGKWGQRDKYDDSAERFAELYNREKYKLLVAEGRDRGR